MNNFHSNHFHRRIPIPDNEETLVEIGQRIQAHKETLSDRGRRRHLSWGMDFDSRSVILAQEIGEDWDESNKELWRKNQARVREEIKLEFGEFGIEGKIENFIAIGSKPFSILSYHNRFFHQVRHAYIVGAYFPALVGACALGERILNHLMIDLRQFFSATPEYRRVYRKKSFDDWDVPIDTLLAWGVLLPDVADELRSLKSLRHRSIHFNVETYESFKDDALTAILHLRTIINRQFGTHGAQPWFIEGTKGHQFISREWDSHPFVQTYFLHNCPFVGPLFSVEHSEKGWQFIDFPDYGEGGWSDEEFAKAFDERTPEMLAQTPASRRSET
ncbi:MAG: hypothetical protein HWE21_10560 [Cytophagia bacterium]|nr:hypothetical protein [Cytophagia bacterium]